MEKSLKTPIDCLNCGTSIAGEFCQKCGQRARDNMDRSMAKLISEFFGNLFFFDNRFFLGAWYLLRYPGRMTVEFLEGKRKKFLSPVTLFLFVNLIYYFASPLSDFSLSLEDQIYSQPYSNWVIEWVRVKLETEGISGKDYAIAYQAMSDNISKTIMIINIPVVALFVYLMSFKRRRYYFDSLIFSFHFFTLFLSIWIMHAWLDQSVEYLFGANFLTSEISYKVISLVVPLLFAILSIKKFINTNWKWAIPAGIGVILALMIANFMYRFIIFVVTFWLT